MINALKYYCYFILAAVMLFVGLAIFPLQLGIGHAYVNTLLRLFEQISCSPPQPSTSRKMKVPNGSCESTDPSSDELYEDDLSDDFDEERPYLTRIRMVQRLSECPPSYFAFHDAVNLISDGIKSIIDDDVTKRFTSVEELDVWNLLTRTTHMNRVRSLQAWIVWMVGFLLRYFFLFPCRLLLLVIGTTYAFVYAFCLKRWTDSLSSSQRTLNRTVMQIFFRLACHTISAVTTFHNIENKAKPGSLCVANHTSPIDVLILSTNASYALTGQRQKGFFGFFENLLTYTGDSIWFDREKDSDRSYLRRRISEYVQQAPSCLPVLLFPEGTCINNTSVMMFRKGSFEIDAPIYPVAIKYDPRLGDPFWNSTRYGLFHYFLRMMTSWAIAVDVYYLPRMERLDSETALDFANRVKTAIADVGQFVNMEWDGMLKRKYPKQELRQREQEKVSRLLKID